MTTIAYRDRILASDGRETMIEQGESPYVLRDDCTKVYVLPDGRLFGASKGTEDGIRLYNAVVKKGGFPSVKCEDVNALIIDHDETIWFYEGRLWQKIDAPFWCIGSGSRVGAWPALKAGAGAIRAVEIGIECDPYSGGKIHHVELQPRKKSSRRR